MSISRFVKGMIAGGAIACGVIGAATLAPSFIANAATTQPPTATAAPGAAAADHPRLTKLYQFEQKAQAAQQQRLDNTGKVISVTQSFIDTQAGKGNDTSALVAALDAYKSAVATAQAHHATAQSALDAHTGFDASGNVTDATQARTTVVTVGKAELQFRLTMNQAAFDLRTQLRLWRVANFQFQPTTAETLVQ